MSDNNTQLNEERLPPDRIWVRFAHFRSRSILVGDPAITRRDDNDVEYIRAAVAAPPGDAGISWSALLAVLERLRSKNRNPDNQWYHGWNAAIQCLINDVNARRSSPVSPSQKVEEVAAGEQEQVQCADCLAWIDRDSNHTCRQMVRRNQRSATK